jgi:hypothetical protein
LPTAGRCWLFDQDPVRSVQAISHKNEHIFGPKKKKPAVAGSKYLMGKILRLRHTLTRRKRGISESVP